MFGRVTFTLAVLVASITVALAGLTILGLTIHGSYGLLMVARRAHGFAAAEAVAAAIGLVTLAGWIAFVVIEAAAQVAQEARTA